MLPHIGDYFYILESHLEVACQSEKLFRVATIPMVKSYLVIYLIDSKKS